MSNMPALPLDEEQINRALAGWTDVDVPTFDAICEQAKLCITERQAREALEREVERLKENSAEEVNIRGRLMETVNEQGKVIYSQIDRITELEQRAELAERRLAECVVALKATLPRLAHIGKCGHVRPTSEWAKHGSMSFDNCQCEIRQVQSAIDAATLTEGVSNPARTRSNEQSAVQTSVAVSGEK